MQTVTVSCPTCHSRLKVKAQQAVVRVRCPKCNTAITARAASEAAEEYSMAADQMLEEEAPQLPPRAHATGSPRGRSARGHTEGDGSAFPWMLAACIGGGATIILCAVIAIVFVNTSHGGPEIRKRPDNFEPGPYGMSDPSPRELPKQDKPASPIPPPTANQPVPPPTANQPVQTAPQTPNESTPADAPAGGESVPKAPPAPPRSTTPQPAAQVPVWTPDAKLVEYLGDPQVIEGTPFRVRLPKGHKLHPAGAPMMRIAMSPGPQSEPTPMFFHFTVINLRSPPGETDQDAIDKSLQITKNLHSDWTQTELERGLINGIVFARVAWSGTEKNRNQFDSGVEYLGHHGGSSIVISATTLLPPDDPLYRLIDMVAFTFERTPSK